MADKPKPPSIKAPKVVPGKETARRIGVDTAFIDGLAAGLVDDEPNKGEAESSGPLFRTDEVDKKTEQSDDDDPLAALLPDLDDEAKPPPPPPSVAPDRKDDLLAALARGSEDSDLKVTVPTQKPLPKGDAAPKFTPEAATLEPKAAAEPKPKAKPEAAAKAKPAPKKTPPPPEMKTPAAATVVTGAEPEGNVHPGMWLVAAACLFGAAMPILMGSAPQGETKAQEAAKAPIGARAQQKHSPGKRDGKFKAGKVFGKFREGPRALRHAGEAKGEAAADSENPAEPEEPEEIVEIEEEETPESKSRRKGQSGKPKGEPEVEKTASQLLTEAKAAYGKGRAGEAYRLASESNKKRRSTEALTVKAKAACKMGSEGTAKKAFESLPMGAPRREVRPVCRDKGIRLGL